ncbi:MAG: Stk1 family PASTA domain-containing Ser/Thr kinase [Tissierellales bacterium]|jgi:serine/threonine-protein kinase|nr:Stk1 family PASTA domain-containing Ser/Thr kinase [Tissierellales bacterium]
MQGKILNSRYEIIEKIGGGGMALVYKAKCQLLNRFVAVKVLRREFTNDTEFIKKFQRESQAAASLSHHNIVNIYDVGNEDGIYYIVMEYVNGITLKDYVNKKKKLGAEETLRIATQIAEALNHAHKNKIIHRDIKPHNIMINRDLEIKVMDFGIARATTSTTLVDGGDVMGSVHYFSPEQARGGYTDEKSDIYALGVVMYEMLTGHVPFEGSSPINVALKHVQENIEFNEEEKATIPENVQNIVMRCVQKEQSMRYSSALELLNDMRKIIRNKEETISYNSDLRLEDSPTMVIEPVKDEIKKTKKPKKVKIDKSEPDKVQLTGKATTLIAIFSALIVASAMFFGYIKIKGFLSEPAEVSVPNLIGFNQKLAAEKLTEQGLVLKVTEEEFNDRFGEGTVIFQSIPEGNSVKEGFTIEVKVSKGYKLVQVPDLTNKMSNQVERILKEAGLEVGEKIVENSELPEEIVMRQKPDAFEKVAEGTKVDYVVSKGPTVKTLMMPRLVGETFEAAKKDLATLGLTLGTVSHEESKNYVKGVVINQTPKASSEVVEGDAINLVISKGIKLAEKPSEVETGSDSQNGQNNGDETSYTNESSVEEKPATNTKGKGVIRLSLPSDKDKTVVTINQVVDGKESLIYKQEHTYNKNGVEVMLLGYGQIRVRIYYDGELKGEKDIVFKEA